MIGTNNAVDIWPFWAIHLYLPEDTVLQVTVISLLITISLLSCKDRSEPPKSDLSRPPLPQNKTQDGKDESSPAVDHTLEPVGNATEKEKPTTPNRSENTLITKLRSGRVVHAIPISKRSLSLKLWLDNGVKAVFKPMLKHNRRAVHEVAVYKLASHLGVDIVPTSTMRSIPLHLLVRLIKKRSPEVAKKLLQNGLTDNKGAVSGAMIQWVDNLEASHLKEIGGSSALTKKLASINPLDDEPPLVEKASRMIVFDYVTGNWDRFSGGNLFVSTDGTELVLIDNNSTFALWSKRQNNRMVRLLTQTKRFSASLIEDLAKLNAGQMDHILAEEQGATTQSLLSSSEIKLLLHRRDTLISQVKQLIEEHGRQKIMTYP
jgi:hypothetical protein